MKNQEWHLQVLKENWEIYGEKEEGVSFYDYVRNNAEGDRSFFYDMYGEDAGEFGSDMTDEQKEDFERFLEICKEIDEEAVRVPETKKELFCYYEEDADRKAKEIAARHGNAYIQHSSHDHVYDCEAMDDKAQRIIDNSVSGECPAYYVTDGNTLDTIAIVAYWTSRAAELGMTIEEFCDLINRSSDFPAIAEEIIEYNGWQSVTGEEFGIAIDRKNKKKAVINDRGEAEVVGYEE